MGTTLTGTFISQTFDALIKVTDNDNLTSTAKRLTDGLGNDSPLFLSTSKLGVGVTPTTTFQVSGNSQLGGNLTVTGNLIVQGTTTTVDTDTLSVKDPLIIVGSDNTSSDAVDLGFYGVYDTSGSLDLYAGLFRDASDAKFHLFKDLQTEPTTTVNKSGTGYTKAGLVIGALEATTGIFSGNVDIVGSLKTDSNIEIQASSGFGFMEIGGPSGGHIDLKGPFSDDFDLRILVNTTSGQINALNGQLDITANTNVNLQHQGSTKLQTLSTGAAITGKLTVTDTGANLIDLTRSNVGTYRLAISGSDAFSIFDVGASADRLIINSSGNANFTGNVDVDGYIQVDGAIKDSSGDAGNSGQILSSTGSGTNWIDNDTGTIDGSGTANDVVMWQDSDTLTDAPIAISGTKSIFGGDIEVSPTANKRIRFMDGSTFKGGIQLVDTGGQMIATSAANDLAIRSQSNIIFSTGGNTERFRIASSTGNATFAGTISSGAISSSASITASGNSNNFGNTTIAALSATSGTFSASVTAAGNSNSFGITTFSGDVTISKAATPLLKLLDTTNNVNLLLGADDTNTFLRGSSGSLILQTNGANAALTLDSSQNAAFGGNLTVALGNINTGKDKYLRFTGESSGSDALILFGNSSGTGGSLTFKRNSDATAILTLNADTTAAFSGNISVGAATTNHTISVPDYTGDAYFNGDRGNIEIKASSSPNSGSQAKSGGRVLLTAGNSYNGQSSDIIISSGKNHLNAADNGKIRFNIGGSTSGFEKMRLDALGNLGISTTSPVGKIHTFSTSTNGATDYAGNNFGIVVSQDNGNNAGDEGNGIVFTQQYAADGVDAGQIRTGAIIGHKVSATGTFGGGLKFKVQPAGANALATALTLSNNSSATFAGHGLFTGSTGDAPSGSGTFVGLTNNYANLQLNGSNGGHIDFSTSGVDYKGRIIYFNSSNSLAFYTNGAGALTLDSSQNAIFTGTVNIGGNCELGANNINFADNGKARFGNSADLQIYHDGSNSFISDTGTGDLRLLGSVIRLKSAGDENMVVAVENAGVTLYYDAAAKLVTTSTGISVTGNISPSGSVLFNDGFGINFGNSNAKIYGSSANGIQFNGGGSEKMRLTQAGDLGIGTSSPLTALDVIGTDPDNNVSRIVNIRDDRSYAANVGGGISLFGKYDSSGNYSTFAQIIGAKTNATDSDYSGYLSFKTRPNNALPIERMRITSSGNVGIGIENPIAPLHLNSATTETLMQITNSTTGSAISDGLRFGCVGNNVTFINRENGSMSFSTNNTAALTIDNSQNATFAGDIKLVNNGVERFIKSNANGGAIKIVANSGATTNPDRGLFLGRIDNNDVFTASLSFHSGDNAVFSGRVTVGTGYTGNNTSGGQLIIDSSNAFKQLSFSSDVSGETEGVTGMVFVDDTGNNQNDLRIGGGLNENNAMSKIRFYTASNNTTRTGTERLRIQGTGEVGIGTTSPENLLHIKASDGVTGVLKIEGGKNTVTSVGEINSQLDFGSNDGSVWSSGNVGGRIASVTEITNGAFVGMAFSTFRQGASAPDSLSEKMRITNDGNVGIGTTTPDNKLDVVVSDVNVTPNSESSAVFRRNGNNYLTILSNSSNQGGILFGNASDNNDAFITYTHSSQTMAFGTADAERMRIDSSGNAMIGTTTSQGALTVVGGIQTVVADLAANASIGLSVMGMAPNNFNAISLGAANSTNNSAVWRFKYNGAGSTNNYFGLGFYANDDILNLKADGNVGIGTTSPDQKLVVNQTATSRYAIKAEYNGTNLGGFFVDGSGNNELFMKASGNVEKVKIDTAGASHFSGGNVGIGTTSPSQKLQVDGTVLANSDVIAFSDKKLKENIKTLDGKKVYNMRGVSFTRKDTGKDSSGVIAQEIQKIAPELVTDNDGTLAVAYGNLTGYLIEAIKELKQEVEELKKQIK